MKRRQASPSRDGRSEQSLAKAIARRTGHDAEKVRDSLAGFLRLIQNIKSDQRVRKIEDPERAAQRKGWRGHRKLLAAAIRREIDARAAEFKQCGVSDPVKQARAEAAKRHGYASGDALKKWLRRNR